MFFNNRCNAPRECCCQKDEKPHFFCKKRVVEVVDIYKIEKIGTRCPKEKEKDCDCDWNDRKGMDFDGGLNGYNELGNHCG